ncbi:MAG: DAK2 domain-containing protein [Lachnospiraceae bacterium]|nr:DAK2 domain-containing protein [Candidatus Minthocola equi]
MFLAGASNLEKNKEWINDLNVFPVPDGDTGTNMTLTILSAVREVQSADTNMNALAKAISSGSLRGARGNSGVILSQLFRGFTKVIQDQEIMDKATIAAAMKRATETAYKAVMKPKEGTILTVARMMSEKAEKLAADSNLSIEEFAEMIIECGDDALAHTPELLPVLKQAGVVDSGGQGLMQFMKGAYMGLTGEVSGEEVKFSPRPTTNKIANSEDLGDIKFWYCTEFLINCDHAFTEDDEADFKAYLNSIGDCVVVVADDDIVKVHVHTNEPGNAITKALTYGGLSRMKIDNMHEEHEEKLIREASKIAEEQKAEEQPAESPKKYGFVAVSSGEGISEVFTGLGVDEIISGGQTMNPSTEDFVSAISKINAENIFLLPNNKNIVLAAEQSQYLVEGKNIFVLHTKTVPQGVTAMIGFSDEMEPEENFESMQESFKFVKTGQLTYAIRDTNIDGVDIHENDYMGIGDDGLLAVGTDLHDAAFEMVEKMVDEEATMITVYSGTEVDEEAAKTLAAEFAEKYTDCDVELCIGGQPVYYYIISVE